MPKNIRSFTLIEIIIVIVLIGILTAFALPNYGKASAKSDERIAIANLIAARSATRMYLVNSGDANIPNLANTGAINTEFGLSILDQKMNYNCTTANQCQATHIANVWAVHFHYGGGHNVGAEIHCTAGTCPSCPNQPGDCG